MRRKDRECNEDSFFEEVFSKAQVLYLAMFSGAEPYCLPLNFVRAGQTIYVHSALQGHKLDCLAANPRVAFSTAIDIRIDTAHSTTFYKSVCGTGLATIAADEATKARALTLLAERYSARCAIPPGPADLARCAIIQIAIEALSGKCHQ